MTQVLPLECLAEERLALEAVKAGEGIPPWLTQEDAILEAELRIAFTEEVLDDCGNRWPTEDDLFQKDEPPPEDKPAGWREVIAKREIVYLMGASEYDGPQGPTHRRVQAGTRGSICDIVGDGEVLVDFWGQPELVICRTDDIQDASIPLLISAPVASQPQDGPSVDQDGVEIPF